MLLLYILQVLLGKYIHARKVGEATQKAHPPSNILHATFGIVLLSLGYLQVCFHLIRTLSDHVMLVLQIRSGLHEWYTLTDGTSERLNFWCTLIRNWAIVSKTPSHSFNLRTSPGSPGNLHRRDGLTSPPIRAGEDEHVIQFPSERFRNTSHW